MTITFPKDEFLCQLFPELADIDLNDEAELEKALRRVSSYAGYTPRIRVEKGQVVIELDEEEARKVNEQHRQIVQLAERGQFDQAKRLLAPLIEAGTQNSDLHRLYGQILEQEGQPDEAIDHLIEALRWDPKDTNALIVIGNIYANHRKDIETAQIYYQRAVAIQPKNYLALTNIAGILGRNGRFETALQYFNQALAIEPQFPNPLYGKAFLYYNIKDMDRAFHFASECRKAADQWKETNPLIVQRAESLMTTAARELQDAVSPPEFFTPLLRELEQKTGKRIEVIVDNNLPTTAKIEIAEYRSRDHHL